MNLNLPGQSGTGVPEVTDELLDPGIDIRAVESRDARFDEGGHVPDSLLPVDRPMVTGKLPTTLDDP